MGMRTTQRSKALSPIATWVTFAIYETIVVTVATHHVFWRDEIRQLTFAIDHPFPQILVSLHHEGHPALWLLILKLGWWLFGSMRVLPVASALIAAGATYLFLVKSPFHPLQKVIFAFGVFPLYEYSVMCRDYGISMLLLFAACLLYKDRLVHPFRYGLILILLANSNVHALVIAVGFLASLTLEAWLGLRERRAGSAPRIASIVLVGIAIFATSLSIRPDQTVTYTHFSVLTVADFPRAILKVLKSPGMILWPEHSRIGSLLICAFGLLLYRHKQVLMMFLVATLGLSALDNLAYPPSLRHTGVYVCFLIALFWIDRILDASEPKKAFWPVEAWKPVFLTGMLLWMVPIAARRAWEDFHHPASSAKALSQLVRGDPALKDAILIGEPDYFMETVPYYLPNDIYLPREERYGRRAEFTTASRERLSLHDLLETARKLKNETGRPVIIALGHPLDPQGPFEIHFSYHSIFEYSPESLREFVARTARLAVFDQARDENYDVYLLPAGKNPVAQSDSEE